MQKTWDTWNEKIVNRNSKGNCKHLGRTVPNLPLMLNLKLSGLKQKPLVRTENVRVKSVGGGD